LHHDERRDAFTKNGYPNWKNAMEKKTGFQKQCNGEKERISKARIV